MTSLFQRRDASVVERLYAPDYIQHNPGIPQGRDALRALVADLSREVYYEPGLIVAEGDLVPIHGRIRGWADAPQVVVDLFRVEDGRLAEQTKGCRTVEASCHELLALVRSRLRRLARSPAGS